MQMEIIIGDVFLASAFLAYGGLYDQQYRRAMLEDWSLHLSASGVAFKSENSLSEYLSTADERQQWHENSLPVDELCTENAIVLKRYNRYPLIIDPSGRVTDFLQKENKDRKLTVTSFLDGSFVKQLESALRFGNPILIQVSLHKRPISSICSRCLQPDDFHQLYCHSEQLEDADAQRGTEVRATGC